VLRGGAEKESKITDLAGFLAGAGGLAVALALAATEDLGLQFGGSIRKLGQNRRWGSGDVVRAVEHVDVVELDREAEDRGFVEGEIGFGAIEPDGGGIIGVAGEEKACTVKEANGIGSVAGSGDDLEFAATEIEDVAVLNVLRDGPGLGAIGFGVEILGKITADLAGGEFVLGVLSGAFSVLAGEVGIHGVDGVELPVAADVVVVSVRI
jgi:hypothetical protein